MPSGSGKITNSQKSSFPGVAPDSFRRTSFASRVRKHDHLQCRQHLVYRLFRRYFYCSILFCSLQQKYLYSEKGCCTRSASSPSQALTRQIPPFVAARHLPPARGKSFLKGRALGSPRKLHLFAKASPFGRGVTVGDGEGEPAKVKNTTSKRLLHRGLCSSLLLLCVILRSVNVFSPFPLHPGGHRCPAGLALP